MRHAEARRVRLVQPRHGRGRATAIADACSWIARCAPAALMLIYVALLVGARLGVRAAARRLSADRRPGLHHHRRADAAGILLQPHRRRGRGRSRNICVKRAGVDNVTFLTGFSFLGQGMNTAQAFITLKDWSRARPERIPPQRSSPTSTATLGVDPRRQDLGAAAAADRQSRQFVGLQLPPAGPRPEGLCRADAAPRISCSRPPTRSPVLQNVYVEGLPPAPQVKLMIDREKAGAFGVTFEDINNTISTNLGSNLRQRLPQSRPHAARDRAGRPPPAACRPTTS